MIVFNNISLKRGQTELLENATATINPKQKVGLVGKNGCGKSSLFALLKKELTPEGGEVTYPSNWRVSWVNQETPALDIPAIDYVIQGDREYCRLQQELNEANERNDGHAIARIHGQLETLDAWTIQSRAASLLHGLGFSQEEIAQPVKSFSGGWRMRLNLAQALLCPSDLLLLDEPTANLDQTSRYEIIQTLKRLVKQRKMTVLISSHVLTELEMIIDHVIMINKGHVVLNQPIDVVQNEFNQEKLLVSCNHNEHLQTYLETKGYFYTLNNGVLRVSIDDKQKCKKEIVKFIYENDYELDLLKEDTISLEGLYQQLVEENDHESTIQ